MQLGEPDSKRFSVMQTCIASQRGYQGPYKFDITNNSPFFPRLAEDHKLCQGESLRVLVFVFASQNSAIEAHIASSDRGGFDGVDKIDITGLVAGKPWSWLNHPFTQVPDGHNTALTWPAKDQTPVAQWVTSLLTNILAKHEHVLKEMYASATPKTLIIDHEYKCPSVFLTSPGAWIMRTTASP